MELAGQAALIVAAFDLRAVQLLRQAIATADLSSKKSGFVDASRHLGPRRNFQPTPRIEQRRVFHPTPRIEPRDTIHVQSRIICDPPTRVPAESIKPCNLGNPIQPPWKVMLWKTPVPRTPQIKVIVHRLDIKTKGSLIDMFI